MARLNREFFLQDTVAAAQALLGCYLVRVDGGETIVCRITETEADVGAVDKACHAYGGRRTKRTETLYAAPGTAYVYLIYGMYSCLNFVTGPEGEASAILVRGCAPVYGADAAARRRFGIAAAEMNASPGKTPMEALADGDGFQEAEDLAPEDPDLDPDTDPDAEPGDNETEE